MDLSTSVVASEHARTTHADRVRFGLIGCGRIGATVDDEARRWPISPWWLPLSHASAIAATEEAELAAVCDVDESVAQQAMRRYRLSRYYVDYRQMLERESLNAVAIATRAGGRKAIIEQSVHSRIQAVYCEKPLCNSLEEADELARLIEQHRVFFVYGTRRRYMPAYQAVRARVEAGDLGPLTTIVIRFGYSALFWGHPHSVDIASFFAGDADIEYVQADLDLDPAAVSGSEIEADPVVRMAHLRFTNGISAHIVASDSYDVELSGNEGMACIRSDGCAVHWRSRLSGGADTNWFLSERVVPTAREPAGTVNSIRVLARAVRDGVPPAYSIRHAVRNQEALFGFVYSHLQGGNRVSFPLERRGMKLLARSGDRFA